MAEQKVAIVTGAGTGIGKAVSLALAKDGYAVVLAGRRADKLDETAKEAGNAKTLAVPTDVSDPESIRALFARTKKEFGRLDLLFNNAGIGAPAVPMEELPLETWKKVVDTNLTGIFVCTQEAIKIMKAQNPKGGRIINNGSISAHTPRPRAAAYTATKHAVTGLTKQTALDCRNDNILCSQIDIGNAATPLTDRMVQGAGVMQPDGSMMQEARMSADDVGRAVVYIANLPLDTNVLFMTVMANGMPFVGRGCAVVHVSRRRQPSQLQALASSGGARCLAVRRRVSLGAGYLSFDKEAASRIYMTPVRVIHQSAVRRCRPSYGAAASHAAVTVVRPTFAPIGIASAGALFLGVLVVRRVLKDQAVDTDDKRSYGIAPPIGYAAGLAAAV